MANPNASLFVLILSLLIVIIALSFNGLLPNRPNLLAELARDQFAWHSSTTEVPISTVSVHSKALLQRVATSYQHASMDDLIPTGDTLHLQPVRNRLNERRLQTIIRLCNRQSSPTTRNTWWFSLASSFRSVLDVVLGDPACDVNQVDHIFGLTPLHLASSVGDAPLTQYLTDHGALPVEDHVGRLPRNLSFSAFIKNAKKARAEGDDCDLPVADFTKDVKHARSEARRLVLEGEPVLLRGAYTHYANDEEQWDVADLISKWGHIDVTVGSVPYANAFNLTSTQMSLHEFYERFVVGGEGENAYVFNKHAGVCERPYNVITSMLEDSFPIDELMVHPNRTGHVQGTHFFLGRSGTGAPFHVHADAVNAAINGRKRWFVYTPASTVYSRKTVRKWVDEDLTELDDTEKPLQCVQHPGDVIYVPLDWGHAVLNLDGNTFGVALELLNKRDTFAHITGHA